MRPLAVVVEKGNGRQVPELRHSPEQDSVACPVLIPRPSPSCRCLVNTVFTTEWRHKDLLALTNS